jgi:hypothetical protein
MQYEFEHLRLAEALLERLTLVCVRRSCLHGIDRPVRLFPTGRGKNQHNCTTVNLLGSHELWTP